jgi:hypothetical protein
MARSQRLEPRQTGRAQIARSLDEIVLGDDPQRGDRRRAAKRALFVGIMAKRRLRGAVQIRARDDGRHWHDSAAKALSDDEYVRRDVKILAGEQGSGACEAGRDFVENQQRAVARATLAHAPPKKRGGASTTVQRIGSAMSAATSPCTSST